MAHRTNLMISIRANCPAKNSLGFNILRPDISAIDESGFAAEWWWAKIPNSVAAGDAGKSLDEGRLMAV